MAMESRILKGLGKVGKALTQENTLANGGFSSLLIHRQVNGAGAALIVGGGTALSFANTGIQGRNRAKLGRVSYGDGMARMTKSFTSGAVPAMKQASGGNYAVFSDMAEETVTHQSIGGIIEDYGATPELISALYNMGGR